LRSLPRDSPEKGEEIGNGLVLDEQKRISSIALRGMALVVDHDELRVDQLLSPGDDLITGEMNDHGEIHRAVGDQAA
jgi:hypothetical protein